MQNRMVIPTAGHIQWHITSACPNRCIHCYMYGKDAAYIAKDDLSTDQLLFIYEKVCQFEDTTGYKFNSFSITGGDPLYHDKGWPLIERLYHDNRSISILGIPEQINDTNIQKMKQFHVSTYQVSLDGLKETHDRIRGKGNFDTTIDGIKTLNKQGIRCHVMFTVNNLNQNELFPLIKYLEEEAVNIGFAFDFMIGSIAAVTPNHPRMLTKEEAKEIISEYHRWQIARHSHQTTVKLLDKTMLNEVLSAKDRGYRPGDIWFGGCGIGEGLCILENGDVYPCRRLPINLGNLLNDSLDDVFISNDTLKQFRDRSGWKGCKDCSHFDICRGCPAVAYAFTGDPFEEMPYCFLKEKTDIMQVQPEEEWHTRAEKVYSNVRQMDMSQLWEVAKKQNILRNLWMKDSMENKKRQEAHQNEK